MTVYAYLIRPANFASRSGLYPLAEAVGAEAVCHGAFWAPVYDFNWRLGMALKRWGVRHYGSAWNALAPGWGEWSLARRIQGAGPHVAHFLFAEFSAPRTRRRFTRRNARVVGTFHASVRRQPTVTDGMDLSVFEQITVVCRAQRAYFLARGVPADRLHITLHGVDTTFFRPDPERALPDGRKPLRGLVVGATERDHLFAAALMKALPSGTMELEVATRRELHAAYADSPGCILHPHLNDQELLRAYQRADLLVMPLEDATANNAILEAMACGTPVMANRVGGVADYVPEHGHILMPDRDLDLWVSRIKALAAHPEPLVHARADIRQHAETLDWYAVAPQYQAVYQAVLGDAG
jgi:glycosyltransferase involved in cell wall biosynthesis